MRVNISRIIVLIVSSLGFLRVGDGKQSDSTNWRIEKISFSIGYAAGVTLPIPFGLSMKSKLFSGPRSFNVNIPLNKSRCLGVNAFIYSQAPKSPDDRVKKPGDINYIFFYSLSANYYFSKFHRIWEFRCGPGLAYRIGDERILIAMFNQSEGAFALFNLNGLGLAGDSRFRVKIARHFFCEASITANYFLTRPKLESLDLNYDASSLRPNRAVLYGQLNLGYRILNREHKK